MKEADISWEELSLIEKEHHKIESSLREIGKSFIDEYLYDIETAGIHSYRYRTEEMGALQNATHPQFLQETLQKLLPAGG